MGLSESQLRTWSNQGATTNSQKTYDSVKAALGGYTWPSEFTYNIYLQGSYRNNTNTRGNSDVDVVAELTSSFRHDISSLSEAQQSSFHSHFPSATHGWSEFRTHIESALVKHYGRNKVKPNKKCITVHTPYLEADVLPCQSYRDYDSTNSPYPNSFPYWVGIIFYVPSQSRWVVNYPKLHYQNGANKNGRT